MKVLANETKRILAVLLSVAMIFAYVPNNVMAYADDVSGNDTEEAAVTETPETNGDDGDVITDEEDESFADVRVQLNVTSELKDTGTPAWDSPTSDSTAASNLEGRIKYASIASGDTPIALDPDKDANDATAGDLVRTYGAGDSVNGYQVYVYVEKGFDFKATPITKVTYKDYRDENHSNAPTGAEKTVELSTASLDPKATDKKYSVEKVDNPRLRLVTLPAGLMQEVIEATHFHDYDKDDPTKKDYFVKDPTICITADEAGGLMGREIPEFTYDSSTTHNAISTSDRTATWTYEAASPATNEGWTLSNLKDVVINKSLTADMIEVTYTEIGSKPVKVKASADVIKQDGATDADNNYVQYSSGNLKIASSWINNFVFGGATITVSIDGSKADEKEKTISVVSDTRFATVYKDSAAKTKLNGQKYNITDSKLEFFVKVAEENDADNRDIKEITVEETTDGTVYKYSDGQLTVAPANAADNSLYKATLTNTGATVIDDNLKITVITKEQVDVAAGNYGVYTISGNKALNTVGAESGKDLTFEVRATNPGEDVTKVEYAIGGGDFATITGANSIYTIPAAKVLEKVYIKATTGSAEANKKITPTLTQTTADLTGSNLVTVGVGKGVGTPFAKTGGSEPYTWSATDGAVSGRYFYFTVQPTDKTYVPNAKYKLSASGDWENAELLGSEIPDPSSYPNDKVWYYRTGIVSGKYLTLDISAALGTTVKVPANPNVTVDFGKNPVVVNSTEPFYFTVTPKASKNSTIEVARVQWMNTASPTQPTNTTTNVLTPDAYGKYCIPAASVGASDSKTNGITLFVYTKETMNKSSYTATFALSDENDDTIDPLLVNTKDASGNITSQKLHLVYGQTSTGNLSATFKTTDRTPVAIDGVADDAAIKTGVEGLYPNLYKKNKQDTKDDIVILKTPIGYTTPVQVNGNQVGTDKITATHIVPAEAPTVWNNKVYTADLDVEVGAAYTDLKVVAYDQNDKEVSAILADEDEDDNTFSGRVAMLVVEGKNVRTGKVEVVPSTGAGNINIDWSFEPNNRAVANDTKTYKMATAYSTDFGSNNTDYDVAAPTTDCNSDLFDETFCFVRANSNVVSPIKVVATCTIPGQETKTILKKQLTIVEDAKYVPFKTVKVSGKKESNIGWALAGTTPDNEVNTTIPNQTLELASDGENSLTVNYDVYKRVDELPTAAVDTKALKDLTDAVSYAKVTEGVTWDGFVYNYDSNLTTYWEGSPDKNEYVKLTPNGDGKFTVEAKKLTPANPPLVTLTAYKDGVIIAQNSFNVEVKNAIAKGTVRLVLDDEATFTVNSSDESEPVQQALNTDAYTKRKGYSVIEPNTNNTDNYEYADLIDVGNKYGAGLKSVEGVAFTKETVGGAFTLPTIDDFDSSKIGANQVIKYWERVTLAGTTANPIGTPEYYYPGEEVTVSQVGTNNIYKAVWAPKYYFKDQATATAETHMGEGLAIYNEILSEGDKAPEDGVIDGYGTAFATANDDATVTEDTAGEIAMGGEIPLVLWMYETTPLTKETKAKIGTGTHTINTETQKTKYVYNNEFDLEVGGTDASYLTHTKGKLTVPKIGSATTAGPTITASWTQGAKTYKTAPLHVHIVNSQNYALSVNDDEELDLLTGQSSNNDVEIVLNKGAAPGTPVDDTDFAKYQFKWTSSDKTVAMVDEGATVAGTTGVVAKAKVSALKAGDATLTLEVIDEKGTSVSTTAENSLKVHVKDNGVEFTVKDQDGNVVDLSKDEPIFAMANETAGAATGYTIAASKPVQWTTVGADDKIVTISNSGVDNAGKITLATADEELSDKGWVDVIYTLNGDATGTKFTKRIKVRTYYAVKLDADTDEFITVDGKKYVDKDEKAKNLVVKVTTDNQYKDGEVYKYKDIDLTKIAAVYEGTKPKDFYGWDPSNVATEATYGHGEIIRVKIANGSTKIDGNNPLKSNDTVLHTVFGDKAISSVTVAQNTVTLSNETGNYVPAGMATSKAFSLTVTPWDTEATIDLVPDEAMKYQSTKAASPTIGAVGWTADPTAAEKTLVSGKINLAFGTNTTAAAYDGAVVLDTTNKKRTDHFSIATITGAKRRAGQVVFSVQSNKKELEKITVNINGYDAVDEEFYENGELITNDGRSVSGVMYYFDENGKRITGDRIITKADGTKIAIIDGVLASAGKINIKGDVYIVGANGVLITGWIDKDWKVTTDASKGVYYADPDNDGKVLTSVLKEIGGKTYYFGSNSEKAVATATANLYEQVTGSGNYYVNAAGEVAINGIYKANGIDRLFRADGTIVSYTDTDVVDGMITLNGVKYVIDPTTNAAKADHTEHVWQYQSMDWAGYSFETQTGTVTAKFVCTEGKEEGTAPATVKVENKAVKGTETELGYSVFKFTATADKDPSGAAASKATETVYKQFKGGAWMDATEADWKKAGGSGETGESENPGQTESEPAQSDVASYQSFNLFYADQREAIPVPGLSEALSNAGDGATIGAKASVYYEVSGDAVKVKSSVTAAKDIKKAATAANSLISVGNGEFVYQLPVYYQKPTLSLSSKKGTRKKNDSAEYTFKTQILEKKSSTNPEPIALEDGDVTADSKLAQGIKTTGGITIEGTTVYLVSTAKASGKLVVDPKDGDAKKWAEPISLSYSIGENSKDVIEVSATNVLMNTNAATVDGAEAQAVTVKLNGQSISDLPAGTTVNVDLSKIKDSGVEVGGVDENGVVTDEAVTFGYTSGIKKGNYKVTFSAGTAKGAAKTTVTVKVANTDIANKAVTYTVKTKLDVTKKQKMVLVPKLNTVGGTIGSDVTVDNEKYVAQYYADSNKIVVGPATDDAEGWAALGGKGNFEQNITLNVGGIDCTTKVKTTITAGKPTVKIANVTFKKASFPGTDEAPLSGETNVLATYKQGGKTFGLEPETDKDGNALVTFTNGGTADSDGWFKDSKTNVKVKYDAESGKILVQTTKDSKAGSVKVEIKYAGQDKVMKKSFSIKTVK